MAFKCTHCRFKNDDEAEVKRHADASHGIVHDKTSLLVGVEPGAVEVTSAAEDEDEA